MRVSTVLAGLAAVACAAAPARAAAPYPVIYAFGDSLSDAGNVYVALGGAEPVSPPYSHGRFSNGPVWVQDLARAVTPGGLGPSLLGGDDFAYGGAQSGQTSVHQLAPNDLPSQLAQFVAEVSRPRATALYTLWIGANDLFAILGTSGLSPSQVRQAEADVIANESAFVSAIAADGASNLLVVDVPDLGKTPAIAGEGAAASAAATALAADFNGKLVTAMRDLAFLYGLRLTVVDAMGLIDQAVADPSAYGFNNVTTPCWTGSFTSAQSGTVCSRKLAVQDRHLFWDSIHPTARGHAAIAAGAEQALGLGLQAVSGRPSLP